MSGKEFFELLAEQSMLLVEGIYKIRDFSLVSVCFFVGLYHVQTTEDILALVVLVLILLLACALLRKSHRLYMRKNKQKSRKFVHLDENNNPTIQYEDLPEIIDFLLLIEKGN